MSRFSIRAAAVLALGGLLVVVLAPSAWAYCPSVPFSKQVRKSEAVWLATIVSAEPRGGGANDWRLWIRVERVLKGPAPEGIAMVGTSLAGPYRPRSSVPEVLVPVGNEARPWVIAAAAAAIAATGILTLALRRTIRAR